MGRETGRPGAERKAERYDYIRPVTFTPGTTLSIRVILSDYILFNDAGISKRLGGSL
jgi:hypothetical protein